MAALALKNTSNPPIRRSESQRRLTPEEYLAIERQAEHKSEYFSERMVMMAGASRKHNLIVGNLLRVLGNQLLDSSCNVYPSDMRVSVPQMMVYTYPDVVVTCGEEDFSDSNVDILLNPIVIIEVLSKSTEAHDRGRKFEYYQQIPSLMAYVLVSQESYKIELYVRQTEHLWLYSAHTNPEGTVTLEAIKCDLSLEDVYRKVKPLENNT